MTQQIEDRFEIETDGERRVLHLTENERRVIVTFSGAFNYDNAEDEKADNATCVTVEDCASLAGMKTETVKGIFGSLYKKGILQDWDEPDMYGVSYIPDFGIDVYYFVKARAMPNIGQEYKVRYRIDMMDAQLRGKIADAVIAQLEQDNMKADPQNFIGTYYGDGDIDINIEVTFR